MIKTDGSPSPAWRSVSRSPARVKNRCAFPLSWAWSITAGAGSVVFLFEDDKRKGRTEGPFVLSSFGGRGGISKVSRKGVCEQAETREPAQAGDGKVKAPRFKQY
ncbi:MAG: hypothetical protein AUG45_08810 [Ktedonobacter sp. 13_1_20CM_3_54_15]|nr:MAG: hypothetical protein AUG45_08810 [Ktedonobacter sp. 13_1_20CM_3_54_15]